MNAKVLQGRQAGSDVVWGWAVPGRGAVPGTEPAAEPPLRSQVASTFPRAVPAQVKLHSLSKTKHPSWGWCLEGAH